MKPSLLIVAFGACRPLSPRGERALAVSEAAARIARTELVCPGRAQLARRSLRRFTRVASPLMLDAWEPEAWSTMRRRQERPDGALLIGFPFSAVYWAARRLAREGVPYVIDLGDPWALTLPAGERPPMGRLRASGCERFVWHHAAAGVVTTQLQADALQQVVGDLPLTVRPNGYRQVPPAPRPSAHPPRSRSRTLRLVHYGNLYGSRLDIVPLITSLARSGEWDSVVLTQQGEDWTGALRSAPPAVRVDVTRPEPWEDVVEAATQHDLAIVVGNRNPAQLPSKAVQYLTLPIPRLAVVGEHPADALSDYVGGKPGWLTLPGGAPPDVAARAVAAHVRRPWGPEDLLPPAQECWDEVAATLVDVLLRHTAGAARSAPSADTLSQPVATVGGTRSR